MITNHHVCLSTHGFINGPDKDLREMYRHPDGRWFTPAEARLQLRVELSKGRKVLPFGEPCEGFDCSGGGCPGHPVEVEVVK